ncbi:YbbR-like domain-containing protein [Bacillus songklensis]|uniref:YbbR-like domain-containing protein n=1 Tax=Bacillus songklensis TaxID=1069116 RepID=A0ABV8AWZ7_9BACI
MKIMALLLALLLYMSVNLDPDIAKTTSKGSSAVSYDKETITDVPVHVYYDSENTIVKGVPEFVQLTLEGPRSIVQPTKLQRDFEVYIDVTNLQLGEHEVKLKHRNISEKLGVKVEPQTLRVQIEEKVSKIFPVQADVNVNNIRDGYIAEQPIVKPSTVKITGAKSEIEKIKYVKATMEINDVSETVEKAARVIALDKRLNKLDVDIQPRFVEVKVPVVSPNKKVGLRVKPIGTLPDDLSIKSLEPSTHEVTVFGPENILNDLDIIDGIELDVSNMTKSESVWIDVPVPKGAKRVYPEKVAVRVDVEKEGKVEEQEPKEEKEEKEEKKVFENLPLSLAGKSPNFDYQLLTPNSGNVNVEVRGPSEALANIQPQGIQLSIDVSSLLSGDHDVSIEVKGPQNVTYQLALNKARVRVIDKQGNNNNEKIIENPPKPDEKQDNPIDENEQSYDDQNLDNTQPQG